MQLGFDIWNKDNEMKFNETKPFTSSLPFRYLRSPFIDILFYNLKPRGFGSQSSQKNKNDRK